VAKGFKAFTITAFNVVSQAISSATKELLPNVSKIASAFIISSWR
jgi:hypothetical protein